VNVYQSTFTVQYTAYVCSIICTTDLFGVAFQLVFTMTASCWAASQTDDIYFLFCVSYCFSNSFMTNIGKAMVKVWVY